MGGLSHAFLFLYISDWNALAGAHAKYPERIQKLTRTQTHMHNMLKNTQINQENILKSKNIPFHSVINVANELGASHVKESLSSFILSMGSLTLTKRFCIIGNGTKQLFLNFTGNINPVKKNEGKRKANR